MQTSRIRATWPFQALADETRFRVVRLLGSFGAPLTAGRLAYAIGIPPTHLSRHLRVLEAAGLILTVRKGRLHYIRLLDGRHCETVCAAVLTMPDESEVFGHDLARLRGTAAPELQAPRDLAGQSYATQIVLSRHWLPNE